MTARRNIFLLLAGLLTGAPEAHAADHGKLPTALPSVQGLASCPGGGFTLPGSTTCIRFGGSVMASTTLRSGSVSAPVGRSHDSLFTQHVVGRVSADVRVQTEMGPLRAYTSLRVPVGGDGPR